MIKKILSFFLISLLLVSCVAPTARLPDINSAQVKEQEERQKKLSYSNFTREFQRTDNITFNINSSNQDICEKTDFDLGFKVSNSFAVGEKEAPFYPTELNLGSQLSVVSVSKNSNAFKTGILIGDKVNSINNELLETGKNGLNDYQKKITKLKDQLVKIEIYRNGVKKNFEYMLNKVCGFPLVFTRDQIINAFADGKNTYITQGIAEYSRDDNELALVIGHELAHNNRKHIEAKTTNAILGSIVGLTLDLLIIASGGYSNGEYTDMLSKIGAQAYSVEFEQEADYAGLYYAKRAGYDISEANEFWTRMGAKNPSSIAHNSTHPATAARFVALRSTVTEINNKIKNGEPLIPNEKKEYKKKDDTTTSQKKKFDLKDIFKKKQ